MRKTSRQQAGFSLLEVIVAMGIVATVMLALVGVMPKGVESIHQASIASIEARIAQEIISDAQSADWYKARNATSTTTKKTLLWELEGERYYDKYGRLQVTRNPTVGDPTIYVARVKIKTYKGGNKDGVVRLQGQDYTNLRTLQVIIEYTPAGRTATFDLKDPKRHVREYTGLVAYMGKEDDRNAATN
jgi:uncharacterized protein (TIGR02598 family)